jgi:tRNA G18 (ribose-2'-O)-methylase SpoU
MRRLSYEELLAQRLRLDELASTPRHPITVVLQDVRSRYNVGSIFRSADAFRIQQLVLTGYTPSPPSTEISKTALGSVDTVPHVHYASVHDALDVLTSAGWHVFAVELAEPSAPIATVQSTAYPLALVLGNELTGVTEDVLARCEGALAIPMFGVKHSLNVAVAAGIAMYEAVRLMP